MAKLKNKKHQLFCDEYLSNGLNGTQAYLSVYKSVKSEEGARVNASKLLTNTNVAAYLSAVQEKSAKKAEVTRDMIIERLNKRSQLVQEIQELACKDKLTSDEQSKLIRLQMVIKTSDANKSDEILNKMLGFNEPDKMDVNHKVWKADFGTDNKKD